MKVLLPASVNHLYILRARTFKKIRSPGYRAWLASEVPSLRSQWDAPALTGPVQVDITVHFPDRRRRDLDNILKAIFDACTQAGIWMDDSQVSDLRVVRGAPEKPGWVEIIAGGLDG